MVNQPGKDSKTSSKVRNSKVSNESKIKVFQRKKSQQSQKPVLSHKIHINLEQLNDTKTEMPDERAASFMQTFDADEPATVREDQVGLIPRALKSIFKLFSANSFLQQNCMLKISFIEIYNDVLMDLLDPAAQASLKLKEQGDNIFVQNLKEIEITSLDQAIDIYFTALLNRKREQTVKNILSSRSHAIFQVKMYSRDKMEVDTSSYVTGSQYNQSNVKFLNAKGPKQFKMATFTFVDLAGSEKIDEENELNRINEAKYINKSLSALGNVIYSLKNRQTLMRKKQRGQSRGTSTPHVPYRDSKLTHLLKGCLNNGSSMTHLIVCLSPVRSSLQETISTMKFAQNAKSIKQNTNESQSQQGLMIQQQKLAQLQQM